MRKSLAGVLFSVVASSFFASSAFATDSTTAQCVAAADLAQQNRDEGKYRLARENMLACSRDTCPQAVRKDCAVWLSELDASAPTLVFTAKMGEGDVANMRVMMDDVVLAEKIDGKPIAVDPGEHKFTFEREGRTEQRMLVVQAGQKNRQVLVVFADPNAPKAPVAAEPAIRRNTSEGSRSIPIASYALTGVAAVGLAGFIGFGLAGKGAVDDMRKPVTEGGCAPTCSQDQVDAAKTKLLIGDIALGVGIGALAGAFAVYFLTPPEEPKPTARVHAPRFNAAATPEGARASVSLTF